MTRPVAPRWSLALAFAVIALAGWPDRSAAQVPLADCPLVFSGDLNNIPSCRLGQFTLTDWLWVNEWGAGGPWFQQLEFAVFDDHLDVTIRGLIDASSYSVTPAADIPGSGLDWREEYFQFLLTPLDPATQFVGMALSTSAGADWDANGADGSLSLMVRSAIDVSDKGTGTGPIANCGGSVAGSCSLGSQFLPLAPGTTGPRMFDTWFLAIAQTTGPAPLDVTLYSPTWTTSIYFKSTTPVPEPATIGMIAIGLGSLGLVTLRRRTRRTR